MGKGKKLTILFSLIVLGVVFFSTLVSCQSSVELPFYFIPIDQYQIIDKTITVIIFYTALFLLIVSIVVFLVVLFYPNKQTHFRFKKSLGSLIISRKSIEGSVREILQNKNLMAVPQVTAKMRKKKIMVIVKGNLLGSEEIFSKSEVYAKEVEESLHRLVGSDVKVIIRIKFVAIQNKIQKRVG